MRAPSPCRVALPLFGSTNSAVGTFALLGLSLFSGASFSIVSCFFYFVFLLASPAPALRPVLVSFSAGPVGLHYLYIFRVLCSDELPAVHLLFVAGWNLVVASARQLQFAAVACWFFRLPLPVGRRWQQLANWFFFVVGPTIFWGFSRIGFSVCV